MRGAVDKLSTGYPQVIHRLPTRLSTGYQQGYPQVTPNAV